MALLAVSSSLGCRLLRGPAYMRLRPGIRRSLRGMSPFPRNHLPSVDAVLGPGWFVEMAAYEGVPAVEPRQDRRTLPLLIGLDVEQARDGACDQILAAGRNARAAGARIAIWLLGC